MTTLLIHALGTCSFDWEAAQALISERTVALDLPFHGGRPLDRPVTFDAIVDDVVAICADVPGELSIAGISLGAAVAVQTAARVPRVRRILAVAPPNLWAADNTIGQPPGASVGKIGRIMLRHGVEFAWNVVRAVPPVCQWDATDVDAYRRRFLEFDADATGTALVSLTKQRPTLAIEKVRAAAVSVAVLGWTDDPVHPIESADRLAHLLAARLQWRRPRPRSRANEAALLARALEAVHRL